MKSGFLPIIMALGVVALVTVAVVTAPPAEERNNDRIGIIGAMEVEVNELISQTEVKETRVVCDITYYSGIMYGRNVVIAQCGMGKVNAGMCALTMISDFDAKYIINTGTSGSLDDRLEIGDMIISTDAVQHDFDASPIDFEKGEIPYTGKYSFEADEKLIQLATKAAGECIPDVNLLHGRVCSGDQFINSVEAKNAITEQFGGLCCEMEGGAIAQVCYLSDTPFVIIRAVADTADGDLPEDYYEFEKLAALRCAAVLEYMVEHFSK